MTIIAKSLVNMALAALLTGCAAKVMAPLEVREGVDVFLLDHGRHSSLVIPVDGAYVRYAFGDWRWYAENDTSFLNGVRALLLPTRAGLGRQELRLPPTETSEMPFGIEHLYEIRVEAGKAAALAGKLGALHGREGAERRYNPRYQLDFAEHLEPYHFLNQSNTEVAQWLEELGCEVRARPLRAEWSLAHGEDG